MERRGKIKRNESSIQTTSQHIITTLASLPYFLTPFLPYQPFQQGIKPEYIEAVVCNKHELEKVVFVKLGQKIHYKGLYGMNIGRYIVRYKEWRESVSGKLKECESHQGVTLI